MSEFPEDYRDSCFTTNDGEVILLSRLPSWMAVIPSNPHVEALRRMIDLAERGPKTEMVFEGLLECARAVAYQSSYPPVDVESLRAKVSDEVRRIANEA